MLAVRPLRRVVDDTWISAVDRPGERPTHARPAAPHCWGRRLPHRAKFTQGARAAPSRWGLLRVVRILQEECVWPATLAPRWPHGSMTTTSTGPTTASAETPHPPKPPPIPTPTQRRSLTVDSQAGHDGSSSHSVGARGRGASGRACFAQHMGSGVFRVGMGRCRSGGGGCVAAGWSPGRGGPGGWRAGRGSRGRGIDGVRVGVAVAVCVVGQGSRGGRST